MLPSVDKPFKPAAKAAPPSWSGKELRRLDGATMLRRMVASCLEQILANAGEIARGSVEAEHVHQLRVGLRRLRSVARGMKRFASGLPEDWEAATKPVFAALGESRDRHVLATDIAPRLRRAGAPVFDLPPASPADAKAIRDLVRGAAFQGALVRLLSFASSRSADDADRAARGTGLATLVRRLRELARQVTRDARRFKDLSFPRQHGLRKRLKRLRYLAEFAAAAFDREEVDAWLKKVSPAQDALGAYIDDVQAGVRIAALAGTQPGARFSLDWLHAREKRSARASRKALARLRRSTAFWEAAGRA
jgi:triphosphatase